MASRLAELLKDLGQKADLHDEYVKDPGSVMDRYELSKAEAQAMHDKDLKALAEMSGLSNLKSNSTVKAHDS